MRLLCALVAGITQRRPAQHPLTRTGLEALPVSQEQANGGSRQQQSFGSRCSDSSELQRFKANGVAASRRLWHTRLAMRPSLSQPASNVNNHKQYRVIWAERPASEVPKSPVISKICGASAVSGSVAVIPPCLCLASVGLCWPLLACFRRRRQARLVVGSRSAWVGGLLANQPTVNSSIKLNKNDGSYLLISCRLLSSFSLLMTVERCQH